MADAFITVRITGLDHAQARLAKLGESLMDFTEAFESLATGLLLFYSQTVFNSKGQALGTPWAPLKASTQAFKNKNYPGRGPLVRTGTMQDSFNKTVTPHSLFIGNDTEYFRYQQLGTGLNRNASSSSLLGNLARYAAGGGRGGGRGRNLPARPMLGINDEVKSMVSAAIRHDIKQKIDRGAA